jgi:hypothetical protein
MTQPKFAPIQEADEVREVLRLPPPPPWVPHRPADFRPSPQQAHRPNTGVPGPDQGYALALAQRFDERLRLSDAEHADDVLAAAVAIAMRRAALYGRAPVSGDISLALNLFGYLDEAPSDLVAARERYLRGAAHDYWQQRDIAEAVPDDTLRLKPEDVRAGLAADPQCWRVLAGLPS